LQNSTYGTKVFAKLGMNDEDRGDVKYVVKGCKEILASEKQWAQNLAVTAYQERFNR
jgi:hypothetical protein